MASGNPLPPSSKLPHLVREGANQAGATLNQWKAELRENPAQFLSSPLVRYPVYLLIAVALFFAVRFAIHAWTPAAAGRNFEQPTQTATLYAACSDAGCREAFKAAVPMNWNGEPLTCPRCKRQTGARAKLCDRCRGWYVPGGTAGCPLCAERERAASRPARERPQRSGDDAEDGW